MAWDSIWRSGIQIYSVSQLIRTPLLLFSYTSISDPKVTAFRIGILEEIIVIGPRGNKG
jgi:hypothetical protein